MCGIAYLCSPFLIGRAFLKPAFKKSEGVESIVLEKAIAVSGNSLTCKATLPKQKYVYGKGSTDSWSVGETYVEVTLTIYNGNIQIDVKFPRCKIGSEHTPLLPF